MKHFNQSSCLDGLDHCDDELNTSMLADREAEDAEEAYDVNDREAFAASGYASGTALDLVEANQILLRRCGMYERALVAAFTGCKHNNHHRDLKHLIRLFQAADRSRLRELSLPVVGKRMEVFRGVAGRGRARRVRGLSWSTNLAVARLFATKTAQVFGLENPGVYRTTVASEQILCIVDDRGEQEVICLPPASSITQIE